MSQKAAIRRRKQMANGMRHLARLGRPIWKPKRVHLSIQESIAREKRLAARQAAMKAKGKKG